MDSRVALADADYVLRWLRATNAPANIIGLQERMIKHTWSTADRSSHDEIVAQTLSDAIEGAKRIEARVKAQKRNG